MVSDHYLRILSRSTECFSNLSEDRVRFTKFIVAHNNAEDLDMLAGLLNERPEKQMFRLALVEYQHALYALAFSHYRQAHVSLRLFLELSLCSILFSAHEMDMHLWLKGKKDLNWNAITSKETGIFSKNFLTAFFDDMKEYSDEYHALALKLYRECSEYVHGNHLSYNGIDSEILFSAENIDSWLERADTAVLVVKFAFISRYLPHINSEGISKIQDLAMESFGALEPVRDFLKGTRE